MIEYESIGLDEKMIPLDSPYARNLGSAAIQSSELTDRTSITATSLGKGMITTPLLLGNSEAKGYIKLDGPNARIIINDGTTDRVLIGFQSGGF